VLLQQRPVRRALERRRRTDHRQLPEPLEQRVQQELRLERLALQEQHRTDRRPRARQERRVPGQLAPGSTEQQEQHQTDRHPPVRRGQQELRVQPERGSLERRQTDHPQPAPERGLAESGPEPAAPNAVPRTDRHRLEPALAWIESAAGRLLPERERALADSGAVSAERELPAAVLAAVVRAAHRPEEPEAVPAVRASARLAAAVTDVRFRRPADLPGLVDRCS